MKKKKIEPPTRTDNNGNTSRADVLLGTSDEDPELGHINGARGDIGRDISYQHRSFRHIGDLLVLHPCSEEREGRGVA